MPDKAVLQSYDRSKLDRSKLISLDLETLDQPTYPLLHQEARFLYILGGRGTIELQGKAYDLRPGALLTVLPWQVSNVTAVTEPLQFYTVVFHLQVFTALFTMFPESDGKAPDFIDLAAREPACYCDEAQQAWMEDFFQRLRREVGLESAWGEAEEKPLAALGAMTLLLSLAVHAVRFRREAGQEKSVSGDSRELSEVLRYMYNHTSEKLTLEGLARSFYVSESSLRRYIKGMTGLGFYDLLNEMRMSKVSGYLLYTNMTLEEISQAVGFWDASHISKVFSEYAGMPLSDYRRTYQASNTLLRQEESRLGYQLSEYVLRHCQEELSPKKVAAHFGISLPEMNRLLLIHTSRNFEDYLNYVRISRAGQMLLETDMTVTEIAVAVGYANVKTFNRNFFRFHVATPTNFRRQISLQPGRLQKEET